MNKTFPYFTSGAIIKGFGRGSKELGFPTANYPTDVVNKLPKEIENGVYFGWANVNNNEVHKMVMSIGWNPFYKNIHRSMETHILHSYNQDLYGKLLKVCICGYLRPEASFDNVELLIEAINEDIKQARIHLEKSEYVKYSEDSFFSNEIVESAANSKF